MPIRIKNVDRIIQAHRTALEATRPRWQQEGREMRVLAQRLSPVDTGLFRKSWTFRTYKRGGLTIINEASQNGRAYAEYVHRAGERITVGEEVRRIAVERLPALRADLSRLFAQHINRG